jgi:hypothetical protein
MASPESPTLGKNLLQKQTRSIKCESPGRAPVSDYQTSSISKRMWDMNMTMMSIRQLGAWAAVAGLCCIVVTGTPAVAQEKMTVQTLIDRQLILDQITRYYYNFGKETKEPESSFYAEDGALILGTRRYEGREAIQSAYGGGARPAPGPGAAPAPTAAPAAGATPAAPRERIPFNMTVDNALIFVHGDTATSQVIYTEYRPEKKGGPVRMTVQGKEFATWVKVKGQWLYKARYVGLSEPPPGWKE